MSGFLTRRSIPKMSRHFGRLTSSRTFSQSQKPQVITSSSDGPNIISLVTQTPFVPDRAGHLSLNMLPQLNEVATLNMQSQPIGRKFSELNNYGLISIVKTQEINIYPTFYTHWKSNDNLKIQYTLRDIGKTSFNLQFDTFDRTHSILLCTNIRSMVVCDIRLKPQPIPEDILHHLQIAATHEKRYFIPPAFKTKSAKKFETSIRVRPSDLDMYYHVNHAQYLTFMLDTAISAAKQGAYTSLKQDIAFSSVDHIVLNYARELRLDDVVTIDTWEDEEHPMKLCFEISANSKLAFQGSILLKEPLLKFSDEMKKKYPRAQEFIYNT